MTQTQAQDSRQQVLVVDDEPANLQVLRHILQEDYRLLFAKDGSKALELAAREKPDLILLDVMMPEMDGYEATRQIKQLAPDLPIIGQSAHVFGDEKDKGFAAGMAAHIAKPIDFGELIDVILEHAPIRRPAS